MFNLPEVARPGVSEYISGSGALSALDSRLEGFSTPLIVTGEKSYNAFKKFYPGNREFRVARYDGTASYEDMRRIADEYGEGVDVVLGVGGGRVIDTAKGVAQFLNKEYITVPTVIATCAPYAPVAAVYHPDRTFREVGYFKRTAYACVADLDLLIESPEEYFVAGIGDTLAKWYEAVVLVERSNKYNDPFVRMGLEAAKITRDVLLRDSKEALSSMKEGKVTEQFKNAVDTVFAIAGAVGCFAVQYGRMAGAHAVHNGLTLIEETHSVLHGTKVSYGILVQLLAEGKKEEVERLIPFYKENNLAYNLASVKIVDDVENKIKVVSEFAASDKETFKLAVDNCTPEVVATAMRELEELTK